MIKIVGNDIMRNGEKIGWIEGNDVRARDGKKLGWFEEHYVYNSDGQKVAYIEGDFLVSYGGSDATRLRLEKVSAEVTGGILPAIGRCAIYALLG
ncbi:MAG: hypothetical protein Q8P49_01385 [Candidatus Liptonbacteria bacterium]|nr:hypothetical protein [Candidatus Liptonbacteria bacterium]